MIHAKEEIGGFSKIFEIGFESYYTITSRTVICMGEARLHERLSMSEHDELPRVVWYDKFDIRLVFLMQMPMNLRRK